MTSNGGDGIELASADDAGVTDNVSAGNLGARHQPRRIDRRRRSPAIALRATTTTGCALNQSDGALIDGNDFTTNDGYGMRIDRSTADFDAAPGLQAPPGTNDVGENESGPVPRST